MSHVLLVDDGSASHLAGNETRWALESYIGGKDFSSDGITTPLVLLAIKGDLKTLYDIHRRLLQGRPVVVLRDTGGVCATISHYHATRELPQAGHGWVLGPEEERVAAELLPEIKRLGDYGGHNGIHALTFHSLSNEDVGDDDEGLGVVLLNSMLNSCGSTEEELLLAVAWGEASILERLLLDRDNVSPITLARALEAALLRFDTAMVQILIDFEARPTDVCPSHLFVAELNAFEVCEGSWISAEEREKIGNLRRASTTPEANARAASSKLRNFKSERGGSQRSLGSKRNLCGSSAPRSAQQDEVAPMFSPRRLAQQASVIKRLIASPNLSDKRLRQQHTASITGSDREKDSSAQWTRILLEKIDGYKLHLEARANMLCDGYLLDALRQDRPERPLPKLAPTWTDLFLWSAMVGPSLGVPASISISLALWKQSRYPLRAALMASQFCRQVGQSDPAHRTVLLERAELFEDWALAMLDAIPDSEAAQLALLLVPQGQGTGRAPVSAVVQNAVKPTRHKLFADSPLQSALEDDGFLSVPCKRVVAHKHSQYCVEEYLSGNYPGSQGRIHPDTTMTQILMQMLLNVVSLTLAPPVFVRVVPTIYETAETETKAGKTELECEALAQLDGDDGGARSDWDETYFFASTKQKGEVVRKMLGDMSPPYIKTLFDRQTRWRTANLFSVPKCKFVTHQLLYVAYMFLPFLILSHDLFGPIGDRTDQMPLNYISVAEFTFWLWTIGRLLDEIQQVSNAPRVWTYFRDPWNCIDVATYLFGVATIFLRILCTPKFRTVDLWKDALSPLPHEAEIIVERWTRCLYASMTVLIWFRMIQSLRIDFELGKLSIILGRMLGKDVLVFLKMQIFISFGFGAAFCFLQPNARPENFQSVVFDLKSPFWMPAWGLMGDFDLDGMLENTGATDHLSEGEPAYLFLPVLLMLYMFLTTIVLVNLLIAQMSSTYEAMSENAVSEWHFARADLVIEYMEKTWLPPPLSIISVMVIAVRKCIESATGRRIDIRKALGLGSVVDNQSIAAKGFALYMDSAHQLEVQRLEREATVSAVKKLNTVQTKEPAAADDVTKRFDELEEKMAMVLDKLKKGEK